MLSIHTLVYKLIPFKNFKNCVICKLKSKMAARPHGKR